MRDYVRRFAKDDYFILKTMKDHEKKGIAEISQNEIMRITGFSKFKVNALVNELIADGHIKYLGWSKYVLTELANLVIDFYEQ